MLLLACVLLLLTYAGFAFGKLKAQVIEGQTKLHSRPHYHGFFLASTTIIPALAVIIIWSLVTNLLIKQSILSILANTIDINIEAQVQTALLEIYNIASGALSAATSEPAIIEAADMLNDLKATSATYMPFAVIFTAAIGFLIGKQQIHAGFTARNVVEKLITLFLIVSSATAILTTIGIICSLLFESLAFFSHVSIFDFLLGTHWSPQIAMHADQAASAGAFGAIPLFVGTLLIATIAMCVAGPVGLLSAIYLVEYTSPLVRKLTKPLIEMLAGIPTVVYGFFAAITVAPWIKNLGDSIGLSVSSESALAAGIVMGVMIIPFVLSLSDDVINAVPQTLRDGSYALGATKSETIKQVVLPAALPGIVGALLLAVSRAIGETMIVVMAAGLAAKMTVNPFDNVTTVTVQIVSALVGDQEFDSPKTLSVFALGLVLFVVTLCLNLIALHVVNRYREIYE